MASAGHHITVVTPFTSIKSFDNYTIIELHESESNSIEKLQTVVDIKNISWFKMIYTSVKFMELTCHTVTKLKEIQVRTIIFTHFTESKLLIFQNIVYITGYFKIEKKTLRCDVRASESYIRLFRSDRRKISDSYYRHPSDAFEILRGRYNRQSS